MVVLVAVAERAAIENKRMIQQSSVAVRSLLQLVEEIGESVHVVFIQDRELIYVLTIVRVMGRVVETIANAALRIDGSAGLVRVQQRRETRDFRLVRKR